MRSDRCSRARLDDSPELSRGNSSGGVANVFGTLGIPPSHRRAVMLHTASWLLFGLFAGSVREQLGFIVRSIGGSAWLVPLVVSGPYVANLAAIFLVPWLERYRARSLVALPRIIAAVLLVPIFLCGGPVSLAVVALIALTVHSLGEVFYGRLLSQLYPPDLRGRLLSLPMLAQGVAVACMAWGAGLILKSGPEVYRWFLPLGAVVGGIGGALILSFPTRAQTQLPQRASLRACLRGVSADRPFLMWTLVYFVTTVGFWLTNSAKPVYFKDILGFGYGDNGTAVAAFYATYCLGFLVWGGLLDRFKSLRVMIASWILFGVGTLVMACRPSFGAAIVGQCLAGLGLAGNSLAWYPVVLEFAPADRVDRYMGFYMTVYGARVLLGGLIGATLMELGPMGSRNALLVASVTILVGVAGMFALRHRAAPDQS